MKKVLVTDYYSAPAIALLQAKAQLEVKFSETKYPTSDEIKDASYLLIRSGTRIDKELLDHATQLQFVATSTSGFNHIDLNECKKRKIKVCYTPEANAQSAAENTLALILGWHKNFQKISAWHRKKEGWKSQLGVGQNIRGKHLGIIGLGRVGQRVAQLAKAFQMEISAHDPYLDPQVFENLKIQRIGLTEIFKEADIISLHVPLTKKTEKMINHQTLPFFRNDTLLVNAARGEVVDELALIEALEKQSLGGAALDVFNKEPLPKHSRLWDLPNCYMTPHIGGYTEQALEAAAHLAVERLLQFINGEPVKDLLPPDAEWFRDQ